MTKPVDGMSLKPLFAGETGERTKRLPFRYGTKAALTGVRYKLLTENIGKGSFQLYDLQNDPKEARDISAEQPAVFEEMKKELLAWNESVNASFEGKDYPEGKVTPPDPKSISWTEHPDYKPYLAEWEKRPEYKAGSRRAAKRKQTE